MPDVTITGLPNATTPLSGTERVPLDQSGVTSDATAQDIANLAPATDLSYTAATRILASSTGADATLPLADGTNAGLMASADFTKLAGVAAGAEVNVNADWNAGSGDAAILNKPTLGSLAALSALGNITSAGAIGSTANLPLITTTAGVVTAGSFGTAANTFCQGNDSRLSDARTPTAHNQAWSTITATPTTRSGYGITDAAANGAITGSGLTMATARLVGRTTASTGAPEEISIGAGLALSAGTLSATGGGGTDQPLFFDAAEFIPRTTNGCGISSEETATNRINRDLLTFDAGAIEYAQKGFVWPAGWATATATFLWKASSGTGSCVWAARMRIFSDGDAEDQAMGTAQAVTDAAASANTHRQTAATAAITPGGIVTSGRHCILEAYRDATNGSDDLSVDALLIGVGLTKAS
jgi:hypothetical protein